MKIDTNNTMAPGVIIGERTGENTQRRVQATKEIAMKTPSLLDNVLVDGTSSERVLQTALTALRQGNLVEVVDQFNDQFTFTDHALDLEFSDKGRLRDFLAKIREHFPDSERKTKTIFSSEDCVLNPDTVIKSASAA